MTKKIDAKKDLAVAKTTEVRDVNTVESTQETRTASDPIHIREILEKQLKELNHKKALADRRELFLEKRQRLVDFLDEIQDENHDGNFETSSAKISFQIKSGYHHEESFNIAILDMIDQHVNRLICDIDKAVEKIEIELVA